MSQQKLRDMIADAEGRINQRMDDHHSEVLRGMGEIRTDFRTHTENDIKAHAGFQGQFNNIYRGAMAGLVGIVAWVFK